MERVDKFIDICRSKGLNVTYQRILIYKKLMGTKTHPTAEAIYHEVKAEYPSISLATVYKTLETLAEHDLINKVTPLHDLARYDADTSKHHHLVCLKCKKVVDIHEDYLNLLSLPAHDGFLVEDYRIQFEGVCQSCKENYELENKAEDPAENSTFCGK